jgi:hypothetical protein
MQLPAIHMNGTSKGDLLEAACDCRAAIVKAFETVHQLGPNARDYYVLGGSYYDVAMREHMDRLTRLRKLIEEFDEIVEGIDAGGHYAQKP